MEKLRLLTLLFLTVVIAACQKDPTQNGSSDPDVVSFQGSVSFKTVDPAEKGLDLIWNADVDRIGLFAADGETVEHANIYYAAFSSAANTQVRLSFAGPANRVERRCCLTRFLRLLSLSYDIR